MKKKEKKAVPTLRFPEFTGDWSSKYLVEIGEFKNGFNADKKAFGKGTEFVNLMDVFGKSEITKTQLDRVEIDERQLLQYKIKKGDVLFVRSSVKREGVGQSCLVNDDFQDTVYSGFIIRFREKNKDLEHFYKKYCFSSPSFRKKVLSLATSSANTNINQESLSQILLPYPSLQEQKKIAKFLRLIDEKLNKLRRKRELLETYKRGVMQQIFTQKIRFQDDDGSDFPEWEEKSLCQITDKISDGIHSTPKYDNSGKYYFINGNNLVDTKIKFFETTKKINEFEYLKYPFELTSQTILMSINGTIGNIAFYRGEKILLGKSACYINLKLNENKFFVFYLLQTSIIQRKFLKELTGTTIKNLSLATIKNTKTFFPTSQEQEKIAQFLTSIDHKIEAVGQQIECMEQFKKGLLQKMFV